MPLFGMLLSVSRRAGCLRGGRVAVALLLCVCVLPDGCVCAADQRANIVWIIADDLGPELGCYGYPGVQTPHIDRLAREGCRYTRAFSTAPVCSASRTAMQTGHYQTTVGGHHHNTRIKPELSAATPTITQLMQQAGYFVSNGHGTRQASSRLAKSHFNFQYSARTFFDGHDWSQRDRDQPFFASVQIKEPHRSFVRAENSRPAAPIPPYYPDHPVTRADWDNYLASIEVLDSKVGRVLDRLDEEGLTHNTLVIFFGDHGRPHVRGKQWLYDGGLHTPFVMRWPGKIRPGTVNDGLTSMLDLMPTTLAAAGLPPRALPGHDLLDPEWGGHPQLFAARDRCGDAPDRIRSIRTKTHKYIRNFHPERPYLQLSSYKKLSYPVETLMKVLYARGEWSSPFMAPTRPAEELYDLTRDPFEMHNLAGDPQHAALLQHFHQQLEDWIAATNDQGAVDESLTVDLPALLQEKRTWYERTMKKRGLDPDLSDEDYLKWLSHDLGADK